MPMEGKPATCLGRVKRGCCGIGRVAGRNVFNVVLVKVERKEGDRYSCNLY